MDIDSTRPYAISFVYITPYSIWQELCVCVCVCGEAQVFLTIYRWVVLCRTPHTLYQWKGCEKYIFPMREQARDEMTMTLYTLDVFYYFNIHIFISEYILTFLYTQFLDLICRFFRKLFLDYIFSRLKYTNLAWLYKYICTL